ncbi:hypothetical protein ACJX0J_036213, partial [Zea mays]
YDCQYIHIILIAQSLNIMLSFIWAWFIKKKRIGDQLHYPFAAHASLLGGNLNPCGFFKGDLHCSCDICAMSVSPLCQLQLLWIALFKSNLIFLLSIVFYLLNIAFYVEFP